MGYRLNRLDEPNFMAVSKPMQTEFGIHHRLESCVAQSKLHIALCQEVHAKFELHISTARCLLHRIEQNDKSDLCCVQLAARVERLY